MVREFFFFQAEDGIRDRLVTGVQTCALPISDTDGPSFVEARARDRVDRIRPLLFARRQSAAVLAGQARQGPRVAGGPQQLREVSRDRSNALAAALPRLSRRARGIGARRARLPRPD